MRDNEQIRSNAEEFSEADMRFARDVLERDISWSVDGTEEYDERLQIMQDVIASREQMREAMFYASVDAGMDIDEEQMLAWQPGEVELQVLRERLHSQRQMLGMIEGLTAYAEDQIEVASTHGVPLRPYQREPVEATRHFLIHAPRDAQGGKSGIIEMPTGTGKTAIFSSIVAQLKYGEREDDPTRVLVLVPNQTILEQTIGKQGRQGFGKFAPHLEVGAYYQFAKQLDKEVVVMTNASFNQLMFSDSMPRFDAVVVDEPHLAIGDMTAMNLMDYIRDKTAIGLDATPEYSENRTAYDIFDHRIYQAAFRDMVRAGRLAPIRGFLLEAEPEVDPRDIPTDPAERRIAMREARLEARMQKAIQIIKQDVGEGRGVIVHCPSGGDIQYAVDFAQRLKETLTKTVEANSLRFLEAYSVGGSRQRQSVDERRQIFDAFNYGDIDVLTYVDAIGVGWDGPHAKTFIDLSATVSAVKMRQGMGRITRLLVDADKKAIIANAYSFVDPELGPRQYTVLDALDSKSGELIDHESSEEAPIPVSRRYRRKIRPEVLSSTDKLIGEVTMEHEATIELPDDIEVSNTLANIEKQQLTLDEASEILCLDRLALKRILMAAGSNPKRPIPKQELLIIMETIPGITPPDLPADSSFRSLRQVAGMSRKPERMLNVLSKGRRRGIEPRRFRDPTSGEIGFYYSEADTLQIVAMMDDR